MPRYVPESAGPPELEAVAKAAEEDLAKRYARTSSGEPYVQGGPHSFFADLLRIADEDRRKQAALASPLLRGRDPGEVPDLMNRGEPLERVYGRLKRYVIGLKFLEERDLGQGSGDNFMRPLMPAYLAELYGRANRQAGTLADALDQRPLDRGMIDTSSGQAVITGIPRLSGGAAVAIQASQNSAVQETDPTTAGLSFPVGSLAGQVDMSRQLFEFSRPGLDEVISRDLRADFGTKLDVQIVNGSGSAGQLRGLLQTAGILSVTGDVSSAAAFQASVWKAYSQLAGTSGFGTPAADSYLTILHPRRYAWARANTTGIAAQALFPGTVVVSAGVPTNLGAGTNEDVAFIVERFNVILAGGDVGFRVFEDVASGTLTVRAQASGSAALSSSRPRRSPR